MPTVQLPPDMPRAMRYLRRDSIGRPVPRFVEWIDGKPDFRIMDSRFLVEAAKNRLCWTCGEHLRLRHHQPYGTFVVGPMCVVNLVSSEPPSHSDCAEWSVKACPFLSNPDKERREANMPEGVADPAGVMIRRNPGVIALVESEAWGVFRANGLLFRFGHITNVSWWARGAKADVAEVMDSIESGLPALVEMCDDDPEALRELALHLRRSLVWVGHLPLDPYPAAAELLHRLP